MIVRSPGWSGCGPSGRKVIVSPLVRRLHVDLCRLASTTCRRG
ncbi:putative leader peptide [Actinomycetospora chlora]